jgi:hypothetical protein
MDGIQMSNRRDVSFGVISRRYPGSIPAFQPLNTNSFRTTQPFTSTKDFYKGAFKNEYSRSFPIHPTNPKNPGSD